MQEQLAAILYNMVERANKNPKFRPHVQKLLDEQSWDTIIERCNTEGSAWIVWWYDGLNRLANELTSNMPQFVQFHPHQILHRRSK